MTVSRAYLILGLVIVSGLTIAGMTYEAPQQLTHDAVAPGHEGHDHGTDDATAADADKHSMATYTFNGVVTAFDVASSKVTIKHDKIEGYGEATTAAYDVADQSMLVGLKIGDEKGFILHVNPKMQAIVGISEPQVAAAIQK